MKKNNLEIDKMSLCNDQDTFNDAFSKAIKDYDKKQTKKMSGPLFIYLLIHLIFVIWGVMLAFKSSPPDHRVIHITLAIVFAPAYVLSYYINNE